MLYTFQMIMHLFKTLSSCK